MKYLLFFLLIACSNLNVTNTTFDEREDEDGIIMDIHNTDLEGWKKLWRKI
jgi:hypothetical protein